MNIYYNNTTTTNINALELSSIKIPAAIQWSGVFHFTAIVSLSLPLYVWLYVRSQFTQLFPG